MVTLITVNKSMFFNSYKDHIYLQQIKFLLMNILKIILICIKKMEKHKKKYI